MNKLNANRIRDAFRSKATVNLESLEVFPEIVSTNSYLLNESPQDAGVFRVALTEHQTAGRGRRGNTWNSPDGSGICLSVAFTFAEVPRNFSSLTLAIGIGVAQALEQLGATGIGLKWPNDIVVGNGKVGGILTEVVAGKSNQTSVVVGLGINVDLSLADEAVGVSDAFELATDLRSCIEELPDKTTISIAIIESMFASIIRYEAEGFAGFHDRWSNFDWLQGREVSVELNGTSISGLVNGIDVDGALVVNTGSGNQRVVSGSVSAVR